MPGIFGYILAIMEIFINVTGQSTACSANASYLDLGPSAAHYVVACLPDVNFSIPASWAGQVSIPGATDDELFFWLFEAEGQSQSDDLIIWLNGGPGCSSLDGLTKENGPLQFPGNSAIPTANQYSWTKLANVLYLDQPVGSGYSDGSIDARLNAQVTQDFDAWLGAFYDIFPSLRSKNTYIMGESYAGIYIPYFAQSLVAADNSRSISIKGIAFGDASFGNTAALTDVVATTYMSQHNDILNIPTDTLDTFSEADERCGFCEVRAEAVYPPHGSISIPGNPEGENYRSKKRQTASNHGCTADPSTPTLVNQSINACYDASGQGSACATFTTGLDYLNSTRPCFSPYNIAYDCTNAPNVTAFVDYLNLPSVRHAIHAPNKIYEDCNHTILATLTQEYVEPPAYSILPALLAANIRVNIYSGDLDYLLNHLGTELAIQNMTWGGKQGFQMAPNNTFLVDGADFGNWGYERGLSYHHILRAGHTVPYDQPAAAFAWVRDFVIGQSGYASVGNHS